MLIKECDKENQWKVYYVPRIERYKDGTYEPKLVHTGMSSKQVLSYYPTAKRIEQLIVEESIEEE